MKYSIEGETLSNIADAIREKAGTVEGITPENMDEAVRSIPSGTSITITMDDNPDGGVDLTINDTTRTLAEEADIDEIKADLNKLPTDVQINGTSILDENKVANIPHATSEQLGFIKTADLPWACGINIENPTRPSSPLYGISLYNTTEKDIEKRQWPKAPILLGTLDFSVKSAMCDGKGADWTAEEQLMAQKRIGIEKEWQLKGTLIDSDIQVDLTGCTELMIKGYIRATDTSNLLFGNGMAVQNLGNNAYRYYVLLWKEFNNILMGLHGQFATIRDPKVLSSNIYPRTNITRTSEITEIKLSNWTVVTECNMEIYAR